MMALENKNYDLDIQVYEEMITWMQDHDEALDEARLQVVTRLQDHDEVTAEAMRQPTATPADALTDAIVRNPANLVDLTDAILSAAQRRQTPDNVIEALEWMQARIHEGAANLDEYQYAHSLAVAAIQNPHIMQGPRPQTEIVSGLERAIEQAPDERNRRMLEHMLAVAKEPHTPEHFLRKLKSQGKSTISSAEPGCPGCCLFFCAPCSAGGAAGCAVCCITSCVLCGAG